MPIPAVGTTFIRYSVARLSSGTSVTNMCPGAWVIMSSGRLATATAWGVTPQAQNTGSSPSPGPPGAPLAGGARAGIAGVGRREVLDPDRPGRADVDRPAVDRAVARGDLRRADRLVGAHGAHGDDEWTGEAPGRRAVDRGPVHGDVDALLDVAD